jgi:hypothetical protein
MRYVRITLALAALLLAAPAAAQTYKQISLRLDGRDVSLPPDVASRVAANARAVMSRCGPNTRLHAGNFGAAGARTDARWQAAEAGTSRLYVMYAEPFAARSLLGGQVVVSEVLIGFGQDGLFVGPDFSRHDRAAVEHMGCDYLASLELACLPELSPFMGAAHRATCAKLERGADGRILLPPPDIAPSCS